MEGKLNSDQNVNEYHFEGYDENIYMNHQKVILPEQSPNSVTFLCCLDEVTEWQKEDRNFVLIKSRGIACGAEATYRLFVNGEDISTGEKLRNVLGSREISIISDLVIVMCTMIFLGTSFLIISNIEQLLPIAGAYTLSVFIYFFMWINAQTKKKREALMIGVFVASFLVAQFTLYFKMYRGTSTNFAEVGMILTQGFLWALSLKLWFEPEKHPVLCSQSPSFTV